MPELPPDRVQEIQHLVADLTTATRRSDLTPQKTTRLLNECRTALAELLTDRDDLVRANGEAGEELARWTGALK
ncbi:MULTISPECIES: hypothetical protein [unclassified Streptomyces]|uniref:hypothetical protein n=1 Tax=unclassified Streptomyces TaxID=2593676 RepID=UPI0037FD1CDE